MGLNNANDTTRQQDIEFLYIGLFKCGICSCSYTAERKVKPSGNECIYYHCTDKGNIKTCKKASYISEAKIDKFMMEILKQIERIPKPIIDELKGHLKELHEQKHDYSSTSKDSIYKRIKEIDNMITNGYKRMLRNDSDIENELWNETYKELRAEKDELLNKLSLIDKADDEYYR